MKRLQRSINAGEWHDSPISGPFSDQPQSVSWFVTTRYVEDFTQSNKAEPDEKAENLQNQAPASAAQNASSTLAGCGAAGSIKSNQ